jgi:hypothetical protein
VKAGVSSFRRVFSWRQLLPALMLVAFALQSYITQTHIHIAGQVVTGGFTFADEGSNAPQGKAATVAGDRADHGKPPPSDDPANCPICQEMLSAGNYVSPGVVAIPLPTLVTFTIASVDVARPFISAVSHDWRGRAPPRI